MVFLTATETLTKTGTVREADVGERTPGSGRQEARVLCSGYGAVVADMTSEQPRSCTRLGLSPVNYELGEVGGLYLFVLNVCILADSREVAVTVFCSLLNPPSSNRYFKSPDETHGPS